MVKGSIHQEDVMTINIYAPSLRESKYMKQTYKELKGEIGSSIITLGDFNTLLPLAEAKLENSQICEN